MKKRLTKMIRHDSNEEGTVSAEKYIKQSYKDLPQGSLVLAGLRYREDLTQKQLGELIQVKQSNISLMERGLRPIGKDIAKRLSEVFKVDYRVFL